MAPGGRAGAITLAPAPDPRWFRCGRAQLRSRPPRTQDGFDAAARRWAASATRVRPRSRTSRHSRHGALRLVRTVIPHGAGQGEKSDRGGIRDVEALDRAGHFKTPDHVAARARALPQAL